MLGAALSFLVLLIGCSTTAAQSCPDLSPCSCTIYSESSFSVRCDGVPMEEVKKIFSNLSSPIDIYDLKLYIQSPGEAIPKDLLGQSRLIYELLISTSSIDDSYALVTVDPGAFLPAKDTIQALFFAKIDMDQMDLKFLASFDRISEIYFSSLTNLDRSFPTLPAQMPSLSILYFFKVIGLNEVFEFNNNNAVLQSNRGLTELTVYDCNLNDKGVSGLLDWILPSSNQTLSLLDMSRNYFTFIPHQLISFQRISYVGINYNQMDLTILNNSFFVQSGISEFYNPTISLDYGRVVQLEPGAFQGNYSSTTVLLSHNNFTRLEEGIFKSVLQDMYIGSRYYMSIHANPFDCYSDPCHLAWLLRDSRHLLDHLLSGQCDDVTYLSNLPVKMFEGCEPVIQSTSSNPIPTPNPSANPNHAGPNVKTNSSIVTLSLFILLAFFKIYRCE